MAVPMHMHNGFPTRRLEQMIMTSYYDVMGIFRAKKEGTIKGEHDQTLRLLILLSGCSGTKHFG